MTCAKCKSDSVPFIGVWLKGGVAKYRCPQCGTLNRLKRAAHLVVISFSIGGLAVIVGFVFRSWWVFGIALVIGSLLDILMDYRFRQLEIAEETNHNDVA